MSVRVVKEIDARIKVLEFETYNDALDVKNYTHGNGCYVATAKDGSMTPQMIHVCGGAVWFGWCSVDVIGSLEGTVFSGNPIKASPADSGAITFDMMLKAMATALKPELAVELTKEAK